MEEENKPQSPLIPPLPRDPRGSLEVFNPSTFSNNSRPTNPVYRSQPSWKAWSSNDPITTSTIPETHESEEVLKPPKTNNDEVAPITTSWMAIAPMSTTQIDASSISRKKEVASANDIDGNDAAAQRAAEWGLVLKTDDETGKLQGVKVRTSGDDQNGGKTESSRRNSGNSYRSSGEFSDDGAGKYVCMKILIVQLVIYLNFHLVGEIQFSLPLSQFSKQKKTFICKSKLYTLQIQIL